MRWQGLLIVGSVLSGHASAEDADTTDADAKIIQDFRHSLETGEVGGCVGIGLRALNKPAVAIELAALAATSPWCNPFVETMNAFRAGGGDRARRQLALTVELLAKTAYSQTPTPCAKLALLDARFSVLRASAANGEPLKTKDALQLADAYQTWKDAAVSAQVQAARARAVTLLRWASRQRGVDEAQLHAKEVEFAAAGRATYPEADTFQLAAWDAEVEKIFALSRKEARRALPTLFERLEPWAQREAASPAFWWFHRDVVTRANLVAVNVKYHAQPLQEKGGTKLLLPRGHTWRVNRNKTHVARYNGDSSLAVLMVFLHRDMTELDDLKKDVPKSFAALQEQFAVVRFKREPRRARLGRAASATSYWVRGTMLGKDIAVLEYDWLTGPRKARVWHKLSIRMHDETPNAKQISIHPELQFVLASVRTK